MSSKAWWKEAIVYQIYPRSFKDSNGDGVGDLQGIIQQLDYLENLGITAVWLNPIYQSPNHDGGYDISDYRSISSEFGTMHDFDELLQGLHARGIKLIMDVVVNHTSDEHSWFIESRKSKDNPYRNYYFWRQGKNEQAPNNWPSFFSGSAWEYDVSTDESYLHLFSNKQPDLNWESETLRNEIISMMKFWLHKGVDGLRLDVISCISKRVDFPDTDTTDFNETIKKYYANGPRLKEFIREMRHTLLNQYDVMTVGEGPGITPENALEYLHPNDGLNMIFHFGHMFMDQGAGGRFDPVPWTMKQFKDVFQVWNDTLKEEGWGSVFLGNHDFSRMVSRWGNDANYREHSSKLLLTLLLTSRGTPFIFQGDELGMTNTHLNTVSDSKDVETHNGWVLAKEKGISELDFLTAANYAGRDNARTPMQWNQKSFAGFSTAQPWTDVNPNYTSINYEAQKKNTESIVEYFKKLVAIRKQNLLLSYGAYHIVETGIDHVFAYHREWENEKWLIVLNFSDEPCHWNAIEKKEKIIGNYKQDAEPGTLRPWEALVFKLT
jgi:oligo-1,6-glucosidase